MTHSTVRSPGLLAVGFERYGSEELLAQNAIMHLFDVYVKVNRDALMEKERGEPQVTDEKARDVFRKMEEGMSTSYTTTNTDSICSLSGR